MWSFVSCKDIHSLHGKEIRVGNNHDLICKTCRGWTTMEWIKMTRRRRAASLWSSSQILYWHRWAKEDKQKVVLINWEVWGQKKADSTQYVISVQCTMEKLFSENGNGNFSDIVILGFFLLLVLPWFLSRKLKVKTGRKNCFKLGKAFFLSF